ncbi:MAG TPA: biopolymer transporter ExbD [Balneolales bacterium]|nr:biopolymer transporter ExbD [Balneolales bacterium]
MFLEKRKKEDPEIPSASLADIAFLLLIFFLVTTTIDVDTGIGLVLPPPPKPNQKPPPIKKRNMLKILVNAQGNILINDKPASMSEVKTKAEKFIDNMGKDPNLSESPDKAVVSLKTDSKTPYRIYIHMLDEVKGAYHDLRNSRSRQLYGKPFDELKDGSSKKKAIKKYFPEKISEAEPNKSD